MPRKTQTMMRACECVCHTRVMVVNIGHALFPKHSDIAILDDDAFVALVVIILVVVVCGVFCGCACGCGHGFCGVLVVAVVV